MDGIAWDTGGLEFPGALNHLTGGTQDQMEAEAIMDGFITKSLCDELCVFLGKIPHNDIVG